MEASHRVPVHVADPRAGTDPTIVSRSHRSRPSPTCRPGLQSRKILQMGYYLSQLESIMTEAGGRCSPEACQLGTVSFDCIKHLGAFIRPPIYWCTLHSSLPELAMQACQHAVGFVRPHTLANTPLIASAVSSPLSQLQLLSLIVFLHPMAPSHVHQLLLVSW